MKSMIYVFQIVLGFVLLTTSCNTDFLETKPLGELSSTDVWADQSLSKAFINGIYENFTHGFNKYMKACYVDEGHRRDNSSIRNFNNCLMTPDNIPGWQRQPTWDILFSSIRRCNLFLDNVVNSDFEEKESMLGEVKFLRAWNYYLLTAMYGGVPIIDKAFELTDEFKTPRDSYEDCINFIINDLDQAASVLPEVQIGSDKGRVTKGAALTLKSRVLLYAASDLYNTTVFPGYSNPELIGYTDKSSAKRTARWQAAKNAAKAVIDMNIYSLYKPNPAPTDSIAENYEELFISKGTVEDIWLRYYTSNTIANDNNLGVMNGPNGYGGQSNNAVIGNLVDEFEMRDGTKFNWNNPAHAALPYNYREPRFYAFVNYEGREFGAPRPAYSIDLDPFGIIHTGYFERWDDATNQVYIEPGIDSRNSPFQPNNSSQTLYLCRKMLDPKFPIVEGGTGQDVPWRYMRYAEVILNYVEACVELEEYDEARTYLNMIRTRAGLPDITESGDALRTCYRHERRIELMYEDHRFFDVRRWVIGPEAYTPVLKANILYKLLPDHTTSPIPTIYHEVLEIRSWIDKAYFFPIRRTEMNKNNLLIQNPDY